MPKVTQLLRGGAELEPTDPESLKPLKEKNSKPLLRLSDGTHTLPDVHIMKGSGPEYRVNK